jgi:ATP-dependent Clp protease adaptor protein ClpS
MPSAESKGYDLDVAEPKVRDRIQPDSAVEEHVEHPRLWKVLLHNDDFTTQEFVVWVLESIFHLPHADAFAIMMHVHQAGVGVAGLFTRDVAETKVRATEQLAEQHEYPLLVTIEPESGDQRE